MASAYAGLNPWDMILSLDRDRDPGDVWGSKKHTSMPLVPMSIPFLALPRELRDMIYRRLLSTKCTKVDIRGSANDSLQTDYKYQFHPYILYTNKQIEREARHVLYTENLLTRINSCGPTLTAFQFAYGQTGHDLPILAANERAKTLTHHVMEVVLLREHISPSDGLTEWEYDVEARYSENCFIITGHDLSRLCYVLMIANEYPEQRLSRLIIAMEISHVMGTYGTERETSNKDQQSVKYNTDLKRMDRNGPDTQHNPDISSDAGSEHVADIHEDHVAEGEAHWNQSTDHTAVKKNDVSARERADITPVGSRMCQLLEPFRVLHSLEAVHIEGPVNPQYKTALIADMCGPEPSDQELFDRIIVACEDAMATYDAGHTSLAVTKLKSSLDTIKDSKALSLIGRHGSSAEPWATCRDLQFTIWSALASASLQKRHSSTDLNDAWWYLDMLVTKYVDEHWIFPSRVPMGHGIAMVFHMVAEVMDALNDLDTDLPIRRASEIERILGYIKEGLRHGPGNQLLEQQLKIKTELLRNARGVEDLMEILDRIYGREE